MQEVEALKTTIIENFGTPCAVIDLDIVEANIARAQKRCDEAGVANRPHIKTHKSPSLAKMQISGGATGITCQKLGEAQVMVDAGSSVKQGEVLLTLDTRFAEIELDLIRAEIEVARVRLRDARRKQEEVSRATKSGAALFGNETRAP